MLAAGALDILHGHRTSLSPCRHAGGDADLLKLRDGQGQSLAVFGQLRRQFQQAGPCAALKGSPAPLAGQGHQVRIEAQEVLLAALNDRIDLDLAAEDGAEVTVLHAQRVVKLGRADENDARRKSDGLRTQGGGKGRGRAGAFINRQPAFAQRSVEPFPQARFGEDIGDPQDQHAAHRPMQCAGL